MEDHKKLLDRVPRDEVRLAPEPDWSLCRPVWVPDTETWSTIKEHAKIGVRALLTNPYFGLYDEMGAMKTAQAIIAAQFLYLAGSINRVIVIAPASVRDVWYDREIGELSLHLFNGLPARVSEFHVKIRHWDVGNWKGSPSQLRWIITNYEFVARSQVRLNFLKKFCGPHTMLILDESSAVRNKGTKQSRACLTLRRKCSRIVQLNGTPIADTPMDLMSQSNILSPSILDCQYITVFRQRYCDMKPFVDFPQIIRWKNLDDLVSRMAPFVLRRMKDDCLDLPPKLPPVMIPVALDPPTWARYKAMRDDLMAWVTENHASIAGQAITKAMRLAQITSGFLGGIEEIFEKPEDALPDFMKEEDWFLKSAPPERQQPDRVYQAPTQQVSSEKIDAALNFYAEHLAQDPAFKLVIWCRFRLEMERLMEEFKKRFSYVRLGSIVGGQNKTNRAIALRLLHPRTAVMDEPALLIGTCGTGAMGHNFTAAHVVLNVSYDYSLFKYLQSSDRNHRPGQTKAVSYFDLVATGPKGQQTIDHTILTARRKKQDMAEWATSAWLDALSDG